MKLPNDAQKQMIVASLTPSRVQQQVISMLYQEESWRMVTLWAFRTKNTPEAPREELILRDRYTFGVSPTLYNFPLTLN